MAYHKGDVVLVPFPFTDLRTNKVRPTLVISTSAYEAVTGNIVVAMITSTTYTTPYDYPISDWKHAQLLHPSTVRMKLATLDPRIVLRKIGRLATKEVDEINLKVKLLVGI